MAAVTAATAAAGLLGTLVAKKQFVDRPKEKFASIQRRAQADASSAANQAADEAAKKAADELKATKERAAIDTERKQDESRRAALSDMLMGEGDTNQRRRFLKGAK